MFYALIAGVDMLMLMLPFAENMRHSALRARYMVAANRIPRYGC